MTWGIQACGFCQPIASSWYTTAHSTRRSTAVTRTFTSRLSDPDQDQTQHAWPARHRLCGGGCNRNSSSRRASSPRDHRGADQISSRRSSAPGCWPSSATIPTVTPTQKPAATTPACHRSPRRPAPDASCSPATPGTACSAMRGRSRPTRRAFHPAPRLLRPPTSRGATHYQALRAATPGRHRTGAPAGVPLDQPLLPEQPRTIHRPTSPMHPDLTAASTGTPSNSEEPRPRT